VRRRIAKERPVELAAQDVGDVEQRSERPGREQRLTPAPEDPFPVATERSEERRLPGACLAAHENDPTDRAFFDVGQRVFEHCQLAISLEQIDRCDSDGHRTQSCIGRASITKRRVPRSACSAANMGKRADVAGAAPA